MHTCVRCGREATLLEEINTGCPCGSKVFVFGQKAMDKLREEGVQAALDASSETLSDPASQPPSISQAMPPEKPQQPLEAGALSVEASKQGPQEAISGASEPPSGKAASVASENGKAPESSYARITFTDEDVENIKIVSEGVFFVDVNALSNNPVVLKDEEGVYYVRIPHNEAKGDAEKEQGNGKKKGFFRL